MLGDRSVICDHRSSGQEMKHLNNYICNDADDKILDFEPDVRIVVVVQSLSHVWLYATPWTAVRQAPLSMGFFRQEYWCGLPCTPLRHLLHPGMEPMSLMSLALAGRIFTTSTTWEAQIIPLHPCILSIVEYIIKFSINLNEVSTYLTIKFLSLPVQINL